MSQEQEKKQKEPEEGKLNQTDFMVEKIKLRPVNRKKLIRRTLTTVLTAVMFGTIACVTFLFLEPIISRRLNSPEEPKPKTVIFPETQDEISPEDMLSENTSFGGNGDGKQTSENEGSAGDSKDQRESAEQKNPGETENTPSFEEQVREILKKNAFGREDYVKIYNSLSGYVRELNRYLVTVTGVSSSKDWFDDVQESKNQVSGIIIADNGLEFLVLSEYERLKKSDVLKVTMYDHVTADAVLKQYDEITGLAVLAVSKDLLSEEIYLDEEEDNSIFTANLSFSTNERYVGMPVIAMGSPMGVSGSVGYGIINAVSGQMSDIDTNYRLIQTDIVGSADASGVLFNMQGKVVGFMTGKKGSFGMPNVITAYSLAELKTKIEKMTNDEKIAYLGITGMDVTVEAHAELGVPYGAFVKKVEMDSPSMLAGIRQGDVITRIGKTNIRNYSDYIQELLKLKSEDLVVITVMRQRQTEYAQLNFNVTLK